LILCTLLGAGIITIYLYSLYLLTSTPFTKSDGLAFFWTSIILFVFVLFGISLADMFIVRNQNRHIKAKQPEIEEYDNQDD
jgi:cation transport ATPase